MKIEILGTGCNNCLKLEENAKKALKDINKKDVELIKITDITEILRYGIMSTPAIIIDGEIKAYGRIPDIDEIKTWVK
ncbi:MAG: TM0996/MTH895 family glutaredoxin-like protein [DPANN group archaeon]|nr:TM0996/MTH895 family glutaredoxin-like protein [DPANN group archaeon]